MLTVVSVSNPEYADSGSTTINCDVVWNNGKNDLPAMPFTATANDIEQHGVDLFNSLINGAYGAISPYVHPALTVDDYKLRLKEIRNLKQRTGVTVSGVRFSLENGVELSSGVNFNAGNDSLLLMGTKAGKMGPTLKWKCNDGVFRIYTMSDFARIHTAIIEFNQDCFDNESVKIREIEEATEPSSVDLGAGWPSTTISL